MIVTENAATTLRSLIGKSISFGLAPHLRITQSVSDPFSACDSRPIFFESASLSLRFKEDKKWVVFNPGANIHVESLDPSFNKEGWAPLSVTTPKSPELFEWSDRKLGDTLDHDTNIYAEGFARVDFFIFDPIASIILLAFDEMAGFIIQHESGKEWCLYADFDTGMLFSFDDQVIKRFRDEADETLLIE